MMTSQKDTQNDYSPIDNYKLSVYNGKVINSITERGELMLPDNATIGKRLRDLRGDRTQARVADALNVTPMAVSLWEHGDRTPNDEMKVRIAEYYGVKVTDIFFTL